MTKNTKKHRLEDGSMPPRLEMSARGFWIKKTREFWGII